jgi:organic hydroperoxide reductase OsmC/OhrA
VFEYAASLDDAGEIRAEQRDPLELGDAWLPEHLVLAAVARCTLAALRFHAGDAAVSAAATMHGTVTRRDDDGRYAFVDLAVDFVVGLDPEPEGDALGQLLARAERDCFVGNSLTVKPRYSWRVNGRAAGPTSTP